MRTKLILILSILFSFEACKKPTLQNCEGSSFTLLENDVFEHESKESKYQNSIFILNEGGFTYGNASISAYNPSTQSVEQNIFKSVNNIDLGDIAQSFIKKGEFTYIVINNSQKIEVVKTKTFERKKTIIGFSSPRYLSFVEDEKVLVTDLYDTKINVVDLATACEETSLKTTGWTEEIFETSNGIWAIERNGIGEAKFANLININKNNFSIEKRISIPIEPNSITKDTEDNLWILSSGLEAENIFPELIKFNTSSQTIEKNFEFNDGFSTPQNLAFNSLSNNFLYNKGKSIYSFTDNDVSLSNIAVLESNASNNIYGIHIHPINGDIYICDAFDYVNNGKVFRYSSSFDLIDEIDAGVIPSKVLF